MSYFSTTLIGASVLVVVVAGCVAVGGRLNPAARAKAKAQPWEYLAMGFAGLSVAIGTGLLLLLAYVAGCAVVGCAS